jgi:hypothetical protein
MLFAFTYSMSKTIIKKNKKNFTEKFKYKRIECVKYYTPKIIKYCTNYLRKLNGFENYENIDKLEDFSPVILNEVDDKHSTTIKYAIDNPNVQNLALTGPYGSGKSSILKTFKHNYNYYGFLNISLATFDDKTFETDKIEHNILKQLFYSVEHKKIPESRFKRIENQKGIWIKSIFFLLWLISLLFFSKVEIFSNLIKTFHLDFYNRGLNILYGLYLLIGSIILFQRLMTFVFNFKLTKFKINETDFESQQDKKTINFESEIDEILYFFERNPIDIVFIQDLDRFKDKSEIFIKLREINSLINNYEPIKNERKVTFVYAVSDDVFKESERAKFFDLIIPVIPIINYTSSNSKLLEKLDLDIKEDKLSKEFIDEVSVFLNDYRTIKSIYNEYQIYKKIIGKQLDDYNSLLAMMIYKNIEPTDFHKLNLNSGYVYSVIEKSSELLINKNQKIDDKIIELNKNIEEANDENLKNVAELRMLYVFRFFELITAKNNYSVFGFHLNNGLCSIKEIVLDEFFDFFVSQHDIHYYYNTYSHTSSQISFSQIEKLVDSVSYIERLEIVKNNSKERLNLIKTELSEFEKQKEEINSKKLFEILDDSNSKDYFDKFLENNAHINNSKLINYLLTLGYINEDYNHYISYFHPGTITKEDNDFLISLLPSEKPLPFNYKLKEVNGLINRIKPANYNRDAILNFTLVDFLIENNINDKLKSIIRLLSKENLKAIKFIDDYLERTSEKNKSYFFKLLFSNWNEIWDFITTKSNLPPEKIEYYFKLIFKYLDLTLIVKLDKFKKLSKHISELEDLSCLKSDEINVELFKKFIINSSVKFQNLAYNDGQRKMFEFIYENDSYAINEKMIELFITNFNTNDTKIENLKTSNYTTIKNSKKLKLIKYIDNNLEKYLENVFLKLDDNINESDENICSILNNEGISTNVDIIETTKFSIKDLSKINNVDYQALLILYNKIDVTWKNILSYYKNSEEFDETLVGFLNLDLNYNVLTKTLIDDLDSNIKSDFPKKLIKSNITDESFSKLAHSLPFSYNDGNEFREINIFKMQSLIESKKILLSTANYIMLAEEFSDLLILFLEINKIKFMESFTEFDLDSSIILNILNSGKFNVNEKILILKNINDDVLISYKALIIKLSDFLLINRIDKISSDLLIELISSSKSLNHKVELTNKYFNFIDKNNLKNVIEAIGEPFSNLLLGKHPKVENNSYNLQLIQNLNNTLVSKSKFINDNKQIELFPYSISRI